MLIGELARTPVRAPARCGTTRRTGWYGPTLRQRLPRLRRGGAAGRTRDPGPARGRLRPRRHPSVRRLPAGRATRPATSARTRSRCCGASSPRSTPASTGSAPYGSSCTPSSRSDRAPGENMLQEAETGSLVTVTDDTFADVGAGQRPARGGRLLGGVVPALQDDLDRASPSWPRSSDDRMVVATLNCRRQPGDRRTYRVMSLPTLLMFRQGEVVGSIVGARPKSYLRQTLSAQVESR